VLPARRNGRWDSDQVAEHLMSCRRQMTYGLGSRSPWAGMDPESLE
jgi:hypothetical protein